MQNISVIITNYNSRDLVIKSVRHVEAAAAQYDGKVEIIVVDDASPAGDAEFLKTELPQCSHLALKANQGYSRANNAGVEAASHDIVVTLNSDMMIDPQFFTKVIPNFRKDNVFAVAAQCVDNESGEYEGGCNGFGFYHGNFLSYQENIEVRARTRLSSHAGGGSTYRRDLYQKFGGYSELYTPFYWEDVDLAFTALSHGYRVVYESKAIIRHLRQGSIRRHFKPARIQTIQARNRILFLWKFTSRQSGYRLRHYVWTPLLIARDLLHFRFVEIKALLLALLRIPQLLMDKAQLPPTLNMNDMMDFIHRDREKLQLNEDVWSRWRRRHCRDVVDNNWVQIVRLAGSGHRILSAFCPAQKCNQYLIQNGNTLTLYEQRGDLDSEFHGLVEDQVCPQCMDLIIIGDHPRPFSALTAYEPLLKEDGRVLMTISNRDSSLKHRDTRALSWEEIVMKASQARYRILEMQTSHALKHKEPNHFQFVLFRSEV